MAAAIFDLDGTLLPRPSAELRLLPRLARARLLGPRQLAAWLAAGPFLKRNKSYLAGLDTGGVARLAEGLVEDTLLGLLRPSILARLRAHQAEGHAVLLLTGAPDFLARPLCARLGIAHCIAAACAARDGRFLAAPPIVYPHGRAKLDLARAFCARQGLALGEAVAYGDAAADAWLLREAGRAVAVHPDPGLARVARARAWAIVAG